MKTMDVRRDSGADNSEADRVQGEMTAVTPQMPQASAGNPERPSSSRKSQTEKNQHPARVEQVNLTPDAFSASRWTNQASVSHWPPIFHRDYRGYINYEKPAAQRTFPDGGDFLTSLELAKTTMGDEWKLPTAMHSPFAPPPSPVVSMRNGVPMNNNGGMIHAWQEPSSAPKRLRANGSEKPSPTNYPLSPAISMRVAVPLNNNNGGMIHVRQEPSPTARRPRENGSKKPRTMDNEQLQGQRTVSSPPPPPSPVIATKNGLPVDDDDDVIFVRQDPPSTAKRSRAKGSKKPRTKNNQQVQGQLTASSPPPPSPALSMKNGLPLDDNDAMIRVRQDPPASSKRSFVYESGNPSEFYNHQHYPQHPATPSPQPLPPSVEHQMGRSLDDWKPENIPEIHPEYYHLKPDKAQYAYHQQVLHQQRYNMHQRNMKKHRQMVYKHQLPTSQEKLNQDHVLERQQQEQLAQIPQQQQQQQHHEVQQQQYVQQQQPQQQQPQQQQHEEKQQQQKDQQLHQQHQQQSGILNKQQLQQLNKQVKQYNEIAKRQQLHQQQQQQQQQKPLLKQQQQQQQLLPPPQQPLPPPPSQQHQQQHLLFQQEQCFHHHQQQPYYMQHHQHQQFMESQRRILMEREMNLHPHAILPYGHLHQYQPLLPRPKPFEKAMLAKQNLGPKKRKRRSADAAVPSKAKKGKKHASPTSSTTSQTSTPSTPSQTSIPSTPSQMPTPSTPSQTLIPSTPSQMLTPSSSNQTPTPPSQGPSTIEGITTYASPSSQPDTFVVDLRNMATKEITSIVHHKPSVPPPSPAIAKENCHPRQRETATTTPPPACLVMPSVIGSFVSGDNKMQGPGTSTSSDLSEDFTIDTEALWDLPI